MINNRIDRDFIPEYVPSEVTEDLRNHLYYVFKSMGFGEPTPIQYGIAEALQNGDNDMILQAGRGTGKSVITSVLVSWWLLRDPNSTVLVVSATAQKAIDFISMIRNLINVVPYMKHLAPKEGDVDNALMFNVGSKTHVTQDKSVVAVGITSQIIGKHADYIVGDDIEVRGNCDTAEQRSKLMGRIHEFESIRNKGGRVVFLGTPHTRDSNYNTLAQNGLTTFKFPALFPDKSVPSQCEYVAPWIWERMEDLEADPGDATQPERFDKETLAGRLARIGPANFSLQFRLDTSLSDEEKYTLKLKDILVTDFGHDVGPRKVVHATSDAWKNIPSFGLSGDLVYRPMWASPEMQSFDFTWLTVDPSGRGSDETAVVVSSYMNGYIFVHEVLGLSGGYDQTVLEKIAKLADSYEARLVRYEENYGDGMFGSLLRPVVGRLCRAQVGVEGYRVQGRKEDRIMDTLEPVLAQHRLIMHPRAIREEQTQIQITRMTRQRGALKHDDRVDALSSAIAYFTDAMSADIDATIEKEKQAEREREIAQFADDNRRGQFIIENHTSGAARVRGHKPPVQRQPYHLRTSRFGWGR